jgi:hypothetical protein
VRILGAIGLILPWALDIAPVLTPLAGETKALPRNVVVAVLRAAGRFAG